eukprot:evm.model.scf_12EXC.10 EVM.evm.TU.scf_12EXC.10   scf_12EXC:95389-100682(+)
MADAPLLLDDVAFGEATGLRAGEHLVDGLAYIDTITTEQKKEVAKLIQEEKLRSTKKPSDYLRELPPLPPMTFQGSKVLQTEYARLRQGNAMDPLDTQRYKLTPPSTARQNDIGAWRKALDNANSQLEHQHNRLLNLELQLKYGPDVWRLGNEATDWARSGMERELKRVKGEISALNQQRKLQQLKAGKELQDMEAEWKATARKNVEIALACEQVEEELRAWLDTRPGDNDVDEVGAEPAPDKNGVATEAMVEDDESIALKAATMDTAAESNGEGGQTSDQNPEAQEEPPT